jgi:hypothetical protein
VTHSYLNFPLKQPQNVGTGHFWIWLSRKFATVCETHTGLGLLVSKKYHRISWRQYMDW